MIQFTIISNSTGVAAKRYWIDPDTGELKHSSAASIYEGTAQVSEAKDLEGFIAGRAERASTQLLLTAFHMAQR